LKITINGPSGPLIQHDGRHPHGHPLRPLTWLANFFSGRGWTLNAGWIITTGSYAGVLQAPLGVPLTIEFGNLGNLSVSFKPQ
jgi:2-keto-4-pentenoate hydratase